MTSFIHSVMFFICFSLIIVIKSTIISTTQGTNNWVTYIRGDSPIIIVSSHDGDELPNVMPNRIPGCLPNTAPSPCPAPCSSCIWQNPCPGGSTSSSTSCPVTTLGDDWTQTIAQCLQNTATFTIGSRTLHPHFIFNNVSRIKLDTNREKGPACLGDSDCELAWGEFHHFINMSKFYANLKCDFGIILDIHGHNRNNYTMLGYDIIETQQQSSAEINDETHATVEGLSIRNGVTLSSIVHGAWSLGSLLQSLRYDWKVTPSTTFSDPDAVVGSTYAQGDFVVDYHGTGTNGGKADAIQVEIPLRVRSDSNERDLFCQHLSTAIVQWVQYWHSTRYIHC